MSHPAKSDVFDFTVGSIRKDIKPFASRTAYNNWKAHKANGGKFDEKGRPIFESWAQIREAEARDRGDGGDMTYDEGAAVGYKR